jgi:hypothetical protein
VFTAASSSECSPFEALSASLPSGAKNDIDDWGEGAATLDTELATVSGAELATVLGTELATVLGAELTAAFVTELTAAFVTELTAVLGAELTTAIASRLPVARWPVAFRDERERERAERALSVVLAVRGGTLERLRPKSDVN